MGSRKRVAILISGRGANMAALIAAARKPDYPAEIAVVLSNRPDAGGLRRAGAEGIAAAVVDHGDFGKDREAFERAVQAQLEAYRIDIVCLAGFMRQLTPWLVSRWSGRMINIHPALLPSFKGLHTHKRALEAGVKIHGGNGSFRGAGGRFGADRRPGRGAGAGRRHAGHAGGTCARGRASHLSAGARPCGRWKIEHHGGWHSAQRHNTVAVRSVDRSGSAALGADDK